MLNCNPKQHLYLKHELEQIVHDDLNTEKEETHSVIALLFMPFGLHSAAEAEHLCCSNPRGGETPGAK